MNENLPAHYRLRDYVSFDCVCVTIDVFDAIKETPKGYWVEAKSSYKWMTFEQKRKHKMIRFVLKNSKRKYCYPDLETALNSFEIRKYRQVEYLKNKFEQAEIALSAIELIKTKSINDFKSGVNVGQMECQKGIDFFPPLVTA